MPEKILRNTFTVPAPAQAAYDHLARPENYIGLSPLVVAVEDVRADSYVAVERFRFLKLKYDNRIRVSLLGTPGRAVWGEVDSPGGVRMAYRFELTDTPDGARIEDELRLRTPFGLMGFAAGQARKVQLARAGILADRLGQPQERP
ncbi:SRPBCC family protein [Nocardia yunnanensis]|uniref:SRPBCC family protein n=1 Tax=Nocardia yunnanensis TaxID=2382165 RepID=A0A386ZDT0_9NOCA|nr:SRPBCC family protein [Nocardia yunnanensis]AYF75686.1 SRPBCC family protein [Nocardia yunnanensis]